MLILLGSLFTDTILEDCLRTEEAVPETHLFAFIAWLFFSSVIALPPVSSHDTVPQKEPCTNLEQPGEPIYRDIGHCPTTNV